MRGSWSYEDSTTSFSGQEFWRSTPEERFEKLVVKHPKGDDYLAVGKGNYSNSEDADLKNAGEAALFLVEGLRWNNGDHIGKVEETLAWLAEQHPFNEMGNERIWMKESSFDGRDEYDKFRSLLLSDETKPLRCREDPIPSWFRDQINHQKEVLIDSINRSFWDIWAVQGYVTVYEVHDDISRDVTVERVRQVLDSFVDEGDLEKIAHPDPDDPRGNPQAYMPVDG